MRLVSREILDVNPLNRNSRRGRYSLIFSRKEKRGLVTTGVGVANQREDTCRFGKRIRRNKTWLIAGKHSLDFDYQTIMVTWIVAKGNAGGMVKRSKVETIRN